MSLFWGGSRMAGRLSCLGAVVSVAPTWQKLGRRRRCCLPVRRALSLLLLPAFPLLESQPYLLDTPLVPCLLPRARGQVAPNPDVLPWSVCCALSWWSKLKDVGRFQERQSKGLTLCFNLLLSQICWGEGVLLCRSVDLCGECSAWFLFEMWEGRREDLFGFFYDLCFQ